MGNVTKLIQNCIRDVLQRRETCGTRPAVSYTCTSRITIAISLFAKSGALPPKELLTYSPFQETQLGCVNIKMLFFSRDWFLYVTNFSEVDSRPDILVCWIAGSGAKVADQLEDEEVNQFFSS